MGKPFWFLWFQHHYQHHINFIIIVIIQHLNFLKVLHFCYICPLLGLPPIWKDNDYSRFTAHRTSENQKGLKDHLMGMLHFTLRRLRPRMVPGFAEGHTAKQCPVNCRLGIFSSQIHTNPGLNSLPGISGFKSLIMGSFPWLLSLLLSMHGNSHAGTWAWGSLEGKDCISRELSWK